MGLEIGRILDCRGSRFGGDGRGYHGAKREV